MRGEAILCETRGSLGLPNFPLRKTALNQEHAPLDRSMHAVSGTVSSSPYMPLNGMEFIVAYGYECYQIAKPSSPTMKRSSHGSVRGLEAHPRTASCLFHDHDLLHDLLCLATLIESRTLMKSGPNWGKLDCEDFDSSCGLCERVLTHKCGLGSVVRCS